MERLRKSESLPAVFMYVQKISNNLFMIYFANQQITRSSIFNIFHHNWNNNGELKFSPKQFISHDIILIFFELFIDIKSFEFFG